MIKKITTPIALLFLLSFSTKAAQSATFNNTASITIVDEAPASLFPSTINVSGMSGVITSMSVSLLGVTHTNYNDVSIVLLGPNGESILLQNGISASNSTISNVSYTLADGSPALPAANALTNGTYKPTNYLAAEQFDSPAPPPPAPAAPGTYFLPGPVAGGSATFASVFGGIIANGDWKLFIQDFAGGDDGVVAGGWRLDITTSGTSLPIQLESFSSTSANCKINLNWRTISEQNMSHYEIERSEPTTSFSKIGQISAANQANSYHFVDELSNNNKSYLYRLKIVDLDAKYSYSNTTSSLVDCGTTSTTLFPNPSNDYTQFEWFSTESGVIFVKMFDQLGRMVSMQELASNKGKSIHKLNLDNLAAGNYFISINDNSQSYKLKFEKLD